MTPAAFPQTGHDATCIRLLALAYPAITKSRPKNASTLIRACGKRHRPKVRLPNSSLPLMDASGGPQAAVLNRNQHRRPRHAPGERRFQPVANHRIALRLRRRAISRFSNRRGDAQSAKLSQWPVLRAESRHPSSDRCQTRQRRKP